MKRFICPLGSVILAVVVSSCAFVTYKGEDHQDVGNVGESVEMAEKVYDMKEFNSIRCDIPADITFTQGDPFVKIVTRESILGAISVNSDDEGHLIISREDGRTLKNVKKLEIAISANNLTDVTLNGAVDFSAEGPVSFGDFNLLSSGASDIEFESLKAANVSLVINGTGDIGIDTIDCESLSIQINGAGSCEVSDGWAGNASATIRGAGEVDLSDMSVGNFNYAVKGAGDVKKPRIK